MRDPLVEVVEVLLLNVGQIGYLEVASTDCADMAYWQCSAEEQASFSQALAC